MHRRSFVSAISILVPFFSWAQVDAGPDQEVCGTSAVLQANIPGAGGSCFWDPGTTGATFADATDPLTSVTNLPFGANVLTWAYITPAGATTDMVTIWAFDASASIANAGPDQLILAPPGIGYMAGSPPIPPALCYWTIVTGTGAISNANDPNTAIASMGMGLNVLRWSCANGPCAPTSDDVVIQLIVSTGISDSHGSKALMIGFDPATQNICILNSTAVQNVQMMDMQGRAMNVIQGADPLMWSMAGQVPGIYLASAVLNGQVHTLRFVLAR